MLDVGQRTLEIADGLFGDLQLHVRFRSTQQKGSNDMIQLFQPFASFESRCTKNIPRTTISRFLERYP